MAAIRYDVLLVIGMAACLVIPVDAFAHLDPPSPKKIKVTVTLDKLKLLEDQDDGLPLFNNDAEVFLSWAISHHTHGTNSGIERNDDLDFDPPTNGEWNINKVIWTHIECDPLAPISVNFNVLESDQLLDTATTGKIAELLSTASQLFHDKTVSRTLANKELTTALLEILNKISSLVNGDDDKGSTIDVTGEPGQKKAMTRGRDGGTEITWTVKTEEVPDPNKECDPLLHPSSPTQVSIDKFFDTVRAILELIPNSAPEPGIDDITEEEFKRLKEEAPDTVMNFVDSVTFIYIQMHEPWPEVDQALTLASDARTLASAGNLNKSLELYEEAMSMLENVPPRDGDYLVILDSSIINIGQTINVTAITTDPNVKHVKFEWIDPALNVARTAIDDSPPFTDSFAPKMPGSWFVKSDFSGSPTVATIYVKFFEIPESAMGIVALIGSSLAVLGFWITQRRTRTQS